MNKTRKKLVTKAFKKAPKKRAKSASKKGGKRSKKAPKRPAVSKKVEKKVRKVCKPSDKKTDFEVLLESKASNSFRCQMAANSLDINVKKKLRHHLKIKGIDLDGDFNIGLIIGASGSGKTTLATHMFGEFCFKDYLDPKLPIIDQLPKELNYDDCSNLLSGVGLTSVPCWIRPVHTLSNGQKSRAEAALILANSDNGINFIDEWTSVVDRTVAKVMSHCVQKRIRQFDKKLILLSCHYDVVEWLDPDWIIDCNKQTFIDRRLLRLKDRERKEKLKFEIREVTSKTWPTFSKYHYLSDKIPGGKTHHYGLFHGKNQIGFQCYANYCPIRSGSVPIFHSNRVVIHPDYAGMGLGINFINATTELMLDKYKNKKTKNGAAKGCKIMAAFSSIPLYKARMNDPKWVLKNVTRKIGRRQESGINVGKIGIRTNVRMFSFEYIGV